MILGSDWKTSKLAPSRRIIKHPDLVRYRIDKPDLDVALFTPSCLWQLGARHDFHQETFGVPLLGAAQGSDCSLTDVPRND